MLRLLRAYISLATLGVCACRVVAAGSPCETVALQSRIDAIAASGGGTLVVSSGVHRTGSLFFKPGVNLHLEEGAVLLGVDDPKAYPKAKTRHGGRTVHYFQGLITAIGCDGFRITGSGAIDGHGLPTWKEFWKRRSTARSSAEALSSQGRAELLRPRLLYVSRSKDVEISGVALRNSKNWSTHFHRVENLFIHDCAIFTEHVDGVRGPSTDAVDLDACRHVVISNVTMNVDDDAVVLKGGRGPGADDLSKFPDNGPSSDILVTDCTFGSQCLSCLTFGSECIRGEDVTMRNCRMNSAHELLRLKLRADTPFVYRNIAISNCTGFVRRGVVCVPWPWRCAPHKGRRKSMVENIVVDCPGMTSDLPEQRKSTDFFNFSGDFSVNMRTSTPRWIGPARKNAAFRDFDFFADVTSVTKGFTFLFRARDPENSERWHFQERDFVKGGRLVVHVRGDMATATKDGRPIGERRLTRAEGAVGIAAEADEKVVFKSLRLDDEKGRTILDDEPFDPHHPMFFPTSKPDWQRFEVSGATWMHPGTLSKSCPRLRKKFWIPATAKSAKVSVTGLGFYELWLDGAKVDARRLMSPSCTDNSRYVLEDSYDLTPRLKAGNHCIGIWLAPGYSDDFSRWGWRWLDPPCARLTLEVECEDCSRHRFVTDETWEMTEKSPIDYVSIYDGEHYDARAEDPSWCRATGDGKGWLPAQLSACAPTNVVASGIPPILYADARPPQSLRPLRPGVWVADFGVNRAGVVEVRAKGARGTAIAIRTAEELMPDGSLDVRTNRKAKSEDRFVLAGTGKMETFRPRFSYHGFRYAEISGYPGELTADDLKGWAVQADLEECAGFRCSNETLNRLFDAARRSMRSNLLAYPSDCCMRDERTPCMMDVQTYQDIACKCFGMKDFFANYLSCIRGSWRKEKCHPDWAGGHITLADCLWNEYGDREMLRREYEEMKTQFLNERSIYPDSIITKKYGDWCPPNDGKGKNYPSEVALVNTALFARQAEILSRVARTLGREEDARVFKEAWREIVRAFNGRFLNADGASYSSGRQVTSVLPLAFGIVPGKNREAVARRLVENMRGRDGGRLDTGLFGTRYLADVLCEIGEPDLAVSVFTQTNYPGFGYMFANGATSLWEQWAYSGPMHSHNHAMLAGAATFLLTHLAGIRSVSPGYGRISVKPVFPKSVDFVKAWQKTAAGRIEVAWKRNGNDINISVRVPRGVSAVFEERSGKSRALHPGDNSFVLTSTGVSIVKDPAMTLQVNGIEKVAWPTGGLRVSARTATRMVESNGVVRADIRNCGPRDWPGLDFVFSDPQNFSDAEALAVSARNDGATPIRLTYKLMTTSLQGQMPQSGTWIQPGETRKCRLPLCLERFVFDKPLDLIGLMRKPAVRGASSFPLAGVTGVRVFLRSGSADAAFSVSRIAFEMAGSNVKGQQMLKADSFFPFVDVFGQANYVEWKGKIHSHEDIQRQRRAEERELDAHPCGIPDSNRYGGWEKGPRLKATGYFRTEKLDGKWWLVDPEGCLFFSHGVNHVGVRNWTLVTGREKYFSEFPPSDGIFSGCWSDFALRLEGKKYKSAKGACAKAVSHDRYALMLKYGEDWHVRDRETARRRMHAWGLNTLCESPQSTYGIAENMDIPYTVHLLTKSRPIAAIKGYWGHLRDPFAPEFEKSVRDGAEKLRAAGSRPLCIGWYSDNEQSWPQRPEALAEGILASPDSQPAKIEFLKRLAEKGIDPEKVPKDELRAFSRVVAEKYYATVRAAIRAVAPNQLYLGDRIAWGTPDVYRACAKYADVVSVNVYGHQPSLDLPPDCDDKPMIVTEFHFGTYDTGYFYASLVPVADAETVGKAYVDYVETAIDHPRYVGTHWFRWQDMPITGIASEHHPSNGQCGLVSTADVPYRHTVDGVKRIAAEMYPRRIRK